MKRVLWTLLLCIPVAALADLRPPFNGISNGSTQQSATFNVTSGTAVNFNSSTATITHLVGTATNDSATAGTIGEYISSTTAGNVNFPLTTVWGDILSITLTPGDWDVTGVLVHFPNGGTQTDAEMAVSLTSGNSTTGLALGDNWVLGLPGTAITDETLLVPAWRRSVAVSTPIYLKYEATYTVATPKGQARISARRVR